MTIIVRVFDRKTRALAVAREAFGELHWQDGRAQVLLEGRTFWLVFEAADYKKDQLLTFHVPLARSVPIALLVEDGQRFHYSGLYARLETGNALFDQRFFVAGSPIEVIRSAFTPDICAWALDVFPGWPSLRVEGGALRSTRGLVSGGEIKHFGLTAPTAKEFLDKARGMLRLADGLVAAYDAEFGRVRSSAGQAAADAWHAAQHDALAQNAANRQRRRRLIFATIAGVLLLVFGCPVAYVLMQILGPLNF